MNPLPDPLISHERSNLEEFSLQVPPSAPRIFEGLDREEWLRRRAEGRANATPKSVYASAIAAFCLECSGVNPAVTHCEGHLCDCALYPVNTRQKRFKSTKTAIKKAIRRECAACLGTTNLDQCASPGCALRAYR